MAEDPNAHPDPGTGPDSPPPSTPDHAGDGSATLGRTLSLSSVPGPSADADRPRLTMTPSQRSRLEERRRWLATMILRITYLTILVVVTLLPFVGSETDGDGSSTIPVTGWLYTFLATFAFGTIVLISDSLLPNKRLASVFAIYFGVLAGLVCALALGTLVDLIAASWYLAEEFAGHILLVKLALGITLCYLAVSVVMTTREDLRLVIPYVEFKREIRGVRPVLLDTSVLIDGRIEGVGDTGFLDAPLVVPQFVVDELQTLADLSDRVRRDRGRRGLDVLKRLQAASGLDVSIDATDAGGKNVDSRLLQLAANENYRILTTDWNLNKVAQIHGVTVLNLNDLAGRLKAELLAGDQIEVEIRKQGESDGQGVGYLPDGTMVVVEQAAERLNDSVPVVVTNSLQTSAGRMVFAKLDPDRDPASGRLGSAAVDQPRGDGRSDRRHGSGRGGRGGSARRNPRRG